MPESDVNAESLEVLQIAMSRFGIKALSDSSILEGICEDRLSDYPKESSLIITAAKSDISTLLQQQATAVGITDAIKLAADSLTVKSSISREASLWVVSQFARVLGYDITEFNLSSTVGPTIQPALDVTQQPGQFIPGTPVNSATIAETPTPQLPRNDQQYSGAQPAYNYPNQPPPMQTPPGQIQQGQPYANAPVSQPLYGNSTSGMYPPGPVPAASKSNNKSFAIVGAVLVIVIAYFIVAGVSHLPPFAKTTSTTLATGTNTTSGNSGSTTSTTGGTSTKAYLNRLNSYIPTSLNQAGGCSQGSTIKTGAVVTINCTVAAAANLPVSQVEYFIFSSSASLYSYYNYLLSKYGITQNQISCGNFTNFVDKCEEIYSVSNKNRGRITEFTYQNTPFVVSTVDNQNIVVGSIGQPSSNGNSLMAWWQSTADWDSLFG